MTDHTREIIKSGPVVSIVMPMRDAEDFVADAIKSVLADNETPLELIVVDDKSSDSSRERVLAFHDERIRVIDGPGKGAAAAMNAGLVQARGVIVMQCDADDLYAPARIRDQVRWLQDHPEYDAVCGAFSTIDGGGRLITDMFCGAQEADITDELKNGKTRTSICTFAIRSSLVEKTGGFREYFEIGQDIDFQLRLGENGRIRYVPQQCYFYRIHASSMTHTWRNTVREYYSQIALKFQQQRKLSGMDDLDRGCPPPMSRDQGASINTARDHVASLLLGRAWDEYRAGQRLKAIKTGSQVIAMMPLSIYVWRSVIALCVKTVLRLP